MGTVAYDAPDNPWMGADEQPVPSQEPATPPDERDDFVDLGRWLTMAREDPEKTAKEMVREFERQDPAMVRRKCVWDRNKFWWWGYVGVRAMPVDQSRADTSALRLYVPLGTYDTQPPMPRAKLLSERQTAHLFSDEPMPDPEPASDSDSDRDAAEFAKRVLLQESGESGFNYQQKFRWADQKGAIYGSGFVYTYVDPTGGGTDKATGEWTPKLKGDVLTGLNVRFLPEHCGGINDAEGVLMLWVRTLGQLKARWKKLRPPAPGEEPREPEDAYIGDDQVAAMCSWRNVAMQWVLPWYAKMGYATQPQFNEDGQPADATLVGCVVCYYVQGPAYKKGAYLLTGGNVTLLHAGTWVHEYQGPDGQPQTCKLDIPLAQFRQYDDIESDDPYGYGNVVNVGPADEVINTVTMGGLDQIDRSLRPNLLVPFNSQIQPEDYQQRLGMPIEYNAQGGEPHWEEIQPFDQFAVYLSDTAKAYQDDASSLQQTAQGLELPSVKSGVQADSIIQQSVQNLSLRKQNVKDGMVRCWRILLQQVAAFFPAQIRLQYTTEDGAYTERAFETSNLTTIKDVKVAVGSFSQLTPTAKTQMAVSLSQIPGLIMDPAELERLVSSGVQPMLGLRDNPVVERIRRQLAAWKDGPDEAWLQAAEQHQMAMQEIQGQVPPGAPPDQAQMFLDQQMQTLGIQPPPSPFDDVASDHEQDVAVLRHRELRRTQQSVAYWRHPEPWRAMLDQAFDMARKDAGIMTLQEQAEAAAAQAQQQVEGEIAKEQAKGEADIKKQDDAQDFAREQSGEGHRQRLEQSVVDKTMEAATQPQQQPTSAGV